MDNDELSFGDARDGVFEHLIASIASNPFFAIDATGNVESPVGWFAKVAIDTPNLLSTIRGEFETAVYFSDEELIGFYLYRRDGFGFNYYEKYETMEKLQNAYQSLEKGYAKWDDEASS